MEEGDHDDVASVASQRLSEDPRQLRGNSFIRSGFKRDNLLKINFFRSEGGLNAANLDEDLPQIREKLNLSPDAVRAAGASRSSAQHGSMLQVQGENHTAPGTLNMHCTVRVLP